MRILFLIILIAQSYLGPAQGFSKLEIHKIEEASNFSFFEPILQNKRIVLLGEMTHGDGATFELKTEVIKYLHEELGYNILAIENGMYSFIKWREKFESGKTDFEDILKAIPAQWSNAEEMKDLFNYLKNNPKLILTGFDSFDNYLDKEQFLEEVDSIAKALGLITYGGFREDFEFLQKFRASESPSTKRKIAFDDYLRSISKKIDANCSDSNCNFWKRIIDGLMTQANEWWGAKSHTNKNWFDIRKRDSTMALNIQYLANEKYKGEKVIVWAANLHVARNLSTSVESDKYFQNQSTITTGEYLFRNFGDEIFSIGTISYSGSYMIPYEWHTQKIKEKSKKTLETYLTEKTDLGFIDFSNTDLGKFKMSGILHYLELKGEWANVYDGVLFIKEMTPATYLKK